jgi:tetratricopeptide (TPR) repeat protein
MVYQRIAEDLEYQAGIAHFLSALRLVEFRKQQYNEALKLYDDSLSITGKLGDESLIANTFHQIAAIKVKQRKYDEALKLYDDSLFKAIKLGDQVGEASTRTEIARLLIQSKERTSKHYHMPTKHI